MIRIVMSIFSVVFLLKGFAKARYAGNPKPIIITSYSADLFMDKDWQIIVKVNKFYIEGIVKSKMKLESVDELTAENIRLHLNISSERFDKDMKDVQEAAIRLQAKTKAMGISCEGCQANMSKRTGNILNVLQTIRNDGQFMKKFFNSIEGINLKEPEVDPECPRAISFLACVAVCSATPPPFNVLCAAACWCEFCRDGQC